MTVADMLRDVNARNGAIRHYLDAQEICAAAEDVAIAENDLEGVMSWHWLTVLLGRAARAEKDDPPVSRDPREGWWR